MKTNLIQVAAALIISARILCGAAMAQSEIIKGGYRPDPFFQTGSMTEQFVSQSNGFSNNYATPYVAASNWGQNSYASHQTQYASAMPFGGVYGGYSNETTVSQSQGFQNTAITPWGGYTQSGQSQLTSHTWQGGAYGVYGGQQASVNGNTLQYNLGGCQWGMF